MEHILDNPAWNALISGNKQLANGEGSVKYFDAEVSPFVGLIDNTEEDFQLLYKLIADNSPRLFVSTTETNIPSPWKLLNVIKGWQMVYEGQAQQIDITTDIGPLTDEHIPQMLTLTKLTNPGPFAPRTIDFGHYQGIFEAGKLIAMTGQRLHAFNYAEVSAVCTHPDHLGKGYARQLIIWHINRIKSAGEIPYLHVRFDNYRAIKVYESLGFTIRKEAYFYVIVKEA